MGAIILATPELEPPSASSSDDSTPCAWLPEKSDLERYEILQKMRATELKWANRCLLALFVLTLVGMTIGLSAWAILRQT